MIIQKTWRGYQERKRLRKLNEGFSKFQKIYQAKREVKDKRKQKQMARDELKFQLVLEHRRRQRQKKVKLLELLEILPADKIEDYLEKQRQYSATKIQAGFRGYRARKELTKHREEILRERAAVKIQRAVISLITWYFPLVFLICFCLNSTWRLEDGLDWLKRSCKHLRFIRVQPA